MSSTTSSPSTSTVAPTTLMPSFVPTGGPTTQQPTQSTTTVSPSTTTTYQPTSSPSLAPTAAPSAAPTLMPTKQPTTTTAPTSAPTQHPTSRPTPALPVLAKVDECLVVLADGHLSALSIDQEHAQSSNFFSQCIRFPDSGESAQPHFIRIGAKFDNGLPSEDYQKLLITSSPLDMELVHDSAGNPNTCQPICDAVLRAAATEFCLCADGKQRASDASTLVFLPSFKEQLQSELNGRQLRLQLKEDMKKDGRISRLKQLRKQLVAMDGQKYVSGSESNSLFRDLYFTLFTDRLTSNIDSVSFNVFSGLVNNSVAVPPEEHASVTALLFPGFDTHVLLSNVDMPSPAEIESRQLRFVGNSHKAKEGDLELSLPLRESDALIRMTAVPLISYDPDLAKLNTKSCVLDDETACHISALNPLFDYNIHIENEGEYINELQLKIVHKKPKHTLLGASGAGRLNLTVEEPVLDLETMQVANRAWNPPSIAQFAHEHRIAEGYVVGFIVVAVFAFIASLMGVALCYKKRRSGHYLVSAHRRRSRRNRYQPPARSVNPYQNIEI